MGEGPEPDVWGRDSETLVRRAEGYPLRNGPFL